MRTVAIVPPFVDSAAAAQRRRQGAPASPTAIRPARIVDGARRFVQTILPCLRPRGVRCTAGGLSSAFGAQYLGARAPCVEIFAPGPGNSRAIPVFFGTARAARLRNGGMRLH
jgi:hypothetical protein